MVIVAVCLIVLGAMVGASRAVKARLPERARIPMQWDLRGRPTWSVRPLVGLAFTPMLYAAVLGAVLLIDRRQPAIIALVALGFLLAHLLHLRLVLRYTTGT
jgi:hypothetical protein